MTDDRTDAPTPEAHMTAAMFSKQTFQGPDAYAKYRQALAYALDAFAKVAVEREREKASRFFARVESIRSDIFYWMIRNHNRGEQSYAKLGETKEALTDVIKIYEDQQP